MGDYEFCECTPVEDSLIACSPVKLSAGDLEAVYVGPSGIYAIAPPESPPEPLRQRLRVLTGTPRVVVYVRGEGAYNGPTSDFNGPLSDSALSESIYLHTTLGTPLWDASALENIVQQIRREDGLARGVYRGEDGVIYVRRRGAFFQLSDKDPDRMLRLTLWGGVFGLHRFAMGKWVTGLLYALTGGLFGLGWFLDVLLCVLGAEKDKNKRIIGVPSRLRPWEYVLGFGAGLLCFAVYLLSTSALSEGTLSILFEQGSNIDENNINGITASFVERFGQ